MSKLEREKSPMHSLKRKGKSGIVVGISSMLREIEFLIKSLILNGIKGVETSRTPPPQLNSQLVKIIKG